MGQSHGLNPLPFLKVLLQSIGYQPRAVAGWEQQLRLGTLMLALAALAAAGLVLGAVRITRKARTFESWSTCLSTLSDRELLMLLMSPTIIAAYTLAYARNALAMQIWYSTHVTVPLVALTYFVVRAFLARFEPSALATVALGVFGVHAALFVTTAPIYFWQTAALHDAGALQRVLPSAKVGLSDAGVTGFFHGQIINTDGLVNDEIADYAPDRLPCCLMAKGIAYFSGFGMSAERAFGLEPYDAYSDKFEWPRGAEDSPLTLYRVDPVRVAALPACASMRARAALGPSSDGVVDHP